MSNADARKPSGGGDLAGSCRGGSGVGAGFSGGTYLKGSVSDATGGFSAIWTYANCVAAASRTIFLIAALLRSNPADSCDHAGDTSKVASRQMREFMAGSLRLRFGPYQPPAVGS